MIQFIIAILMGLACSSGNSSYNGDKKCNGSGYSTMDTGGENGQIPPPPIKDPDDE